MPTRDGERSPLTPEQFARSRRIVRRSVVFSGLADVAIAAYVATFEPVIAVVLVAVGVFGSFGILEYLDRDWRRRGYDV